MEPSWPEWPTGRFAQFGAPPYRSNAGGKVRPSLAVSPSLPRAGSTNPKGIAGRGSRDVVRVSRQCPSSRGRGWWVYARPLTPARSAGPCLRRLFEPTSVPASAIKSPRYSPVQPCREGHAASTLGCCDDLGARKGNAAGRLQDRVSDRDDHLELFGPLSAKLCAGPRRHFSDHQFRRWLRSKELMTGRFNLMCAVQHD